MTSLEWALLTMIGATFVWVTLSVSTVGVAIAGLLARADNGTALVVARAPDAPFLALARVDSLWMGNRRFTLVAGVRVDEHFLERLSRDTDIEVSLIHPEGRLPADTSVVVGEQTIVRELEVTFLQVLPEDASDLAEYRARRELAELASDEVPAPCEILVVRSSDVVGEVAARSREYDLVVLGLQRLGKRRKMLGDAARLLAQETDCGLIMISRRG